MLNKAMMLCGGKKKRYELTVKFVNQTKWTIGLRIRQEANQHKVYFTDGNYWFNLPDLPPQDTIPPMGTLEYVVPLENWDVVDGVSDGGVKLAVYTGALTPDYLWYDPDGHQVGYTYISRTVSQGWVAEGALGGYVQLGKGEPPPREFCCTITAIEEID